MADQVKLFEAGIQRYKVGIDMPIFCATSFGEEKKGDLAGVFVYKFKIHTQEFLLAYEWDPSNRLLLALGVQDACANGAATI